MTKPIMSAMLSTSGTTLTDAEKKLLEQANPMGISLFSRNIASKEQIKTLVKEIKETIGRKDVLIAIDQEGGRVRRLAEPEFQSYAAEITLGQLGDKQTIKNHATLISADLQELGINWNYAPVLDVAYQDTTASLKSRCFGSDEKKVAQFGKIMIDEYINQGILPCIKHMPGHGRAKVDPHLNLPILNNSLQELEKDFFPFRVMNYSPAGMTAHIIVSAVDEHLPITQSKKAISTIIRDIIGFKGLLISDAIDMKALKGSVGEKTKTSLKAGCDCICYCFGIYDELLEVTQNCAPMSDEAMLRFSNIQSIIKKTAIKNDLLALSQQYKDSTGTIESYKDDYDATEILHKMKKE